MEGHRNMGRVAIVTDTNSGMTAEEAKERGIFLLQMPVIINDREYTEGVDLTYSEFCWQLETGADVKTSQPSPLAVTELWDGILRSGGYDEIVHIPMSSALSGSMQTAAALAADYDGKVEVVDNKRISNTLRQSAIDAAALSDMGFSAASIKEKLEEDALNASIYLAVNTLELLKKSGRVTPSAAALASVLNIKPVLTIQGEKLDSFAKVRGMKKAEKVMLNQLEKDREERFADRASYIFAAYSGLEAEARPWLDKVRDYFHDESIRIHRLPVSITCHVSTGVKAIGIVSYIEK